MRFGTYHLTYCLNVHSGITLAEVEQNIADYVMPLKARLSPDAPFGVGLRLAGKASEEALDGDNLSALRELLESNDLYVFTMNGFPYGPFHGTKVKADVHAPHWDDPERLAYTKRLIDVLAELLPEGLDGGISTNPFGYRPLIKADEDSVWRTFVERMVDVAEYLSIVQQHTGKPIHLDIEPEPDGLIGNCVELIAFFKKWLLPKGVPMLAERLQVSEDTARIALLDHIQVCFDTCHAAVSYEDPEDILNRFAQSGIKVGKIQVSSAVKVDLEDEPAQRSTQAASIREFDEPVYLHQVIQRNIDGSLTAFQDLPEALPNIEKPHAKEWRIHFHVPVFLEHFGIFGSTQETIVQAFEVLNNRDITNHLEIETYTWDVLPEHLKLPIDQSIEREYQWVINGLD